MCANVHVEDILGTSRSQQRVEVNGPSLKSWDTQMGFRRPTRTSAVPKFAA